MYRKLRAIHLCTGLFCLSFLLMYTLSAIQMAHRQWWPIPGRVTERTVPLSPGLTDARAASRALALRGELGSINSSPGVLRFRVFRPGTVNQVEYFVTTGEAKVKTTDTTLAGMLNRIHHAEGLWHEFAPMNAWVVAMGVVSVGLLLLGATGLYLWFRDSRERLVGAALLVAGSGLAATLIVWMRR